MRTSRARLSLRPPTPRVIRESPFHALHSPSILARRLQPDPDFRMKANTSPNRISRPSIQPGTIDARGLPCPDLHKCLAPFAAQPKGPTSSPLPPSVERRARPAASLSSGQGGLLRAGSLVPCAHTTGKVHIAEARDGVEAETLLPIVSGVGDLPRTRSRVPSRGNRQFR
eukprot:scaffold14900_cov103-Isochrysis_galbana.AAC.7